jgi:hypothetical protein
MVWGRSSCRKSSSESLRAPPKVHTETKIPKYNKHCLRVLHLSWMWNLSCRQTIKRAWIQQGKVPDGLPGTGVWKRT